MTPEEKFNQDVWWILQEIKKDNYLTPKGQRVEFSLRSLPKTNGVSRRKDVDYGFPQEEVQQKLLFKLQEWEALDVQPVDNILRGSDIFNPRIYDLTIKQPKFDELYKKYELANSPKETEQWVKPILRKIKDGKLPYKKDGLFYSLWKYANASRLTGKSLITFMDLAPLERSSRIAIFEFLNSLQELKIELENITFHEDIYKKYCKTQHDYIADYTAKNPKADFSKAVKKLFRNQATFEDIFKILGKFDELLKMKLQLNGLLEFVEFSPSPSAKNIKPLKEHLETYINCFIEDKLFSPEFKNFYQFSRQKEIFLQRIKREVEDYGLEFVFRQGETVSVTRGLVVSIGKDEAYLFIHTLVALEKQGYFEIESILITDMDAPPEKQTDDYKVKIVISEKLRELKQSLAAETTDLEKLYEQQRSLIFRIQELEKTIDEEVEKIRHNPDFPKGLADRRIAAAKEQSEPQLTSLENQLEVVNNLIATVQVKKGKPLEKTESIIEDEYKISVKDREIWISKYLIGKPYATGSNFEFFEYIRSQKSNTKINRETLQNFGGLSLKEQVKSKSFIKIVNELGFKGEILKAFFCNRGKDTLTYRGDQITKEDLEKAGVKKSLFLKELELAHAKNSPE